MGFGISTLKRTISTLIIGAVLFAGTVISAEAQGRHGRLMRRHGRGLHLGWRNRDVNDERKYRRRALKRYQKEVKRALRERQRYERRALRDSYDGDRVYYAQQRRDLSRRQRLERRQFRSSWRHNR